MKVRPNRPAAAVPGRASPATGARAAIASTRASIACFMRLPVLSIQITSVATRIAPAIISQPSYASSWTSRAANAAAQARLAATPAARPA